LFYYNNNSNALLPNIEDSSNCLYKWQYLVSVVDYTFEGDFNGYPLKRNDLTNTLDGNKSKETFTYEEF
jgi:hypothetical protein